VRGFGTAALISRERGCLRTEHAAVFRGESRS
jgi:hypothetical protein